MGKGPYLLSQNVMEESRLCWGGPNHNNFFNKPNICYNTAVMCDNNVITCSRKQPDVGLKYDSDSGKHAFRDFNKVCNNIDFSNTCVLITMMAVHVLQTSCMAFGSTC